MDERAIRKAMEEARPAYEEEAERILAALPARLRNCRLTEPERQRLIRKLLEGADLTPEERSKLEERLDPEPQ